MLSQFLPEDQSNTHEYRQPHNHADGPRSVKQPDDEVSIVTVPGSSGTVTEEGVTRILRIELFGQDVESVRVGLR